MPSNYSEFHVYRESNYGVIESVAGASVKVFNADAGAELAVLTADADGLIAAGTLNVAAGTRVRFRIENLSGLAGSITQITT